MTEGGAREDLTGSWATCGEGLVVHLAQYREVAQVAAVVP